ncbi:Ankyrin repeats domain-containing protein [Phytophthora infestans]|uniref:Ankyrin repeats domain-containing protein n=1 Tax=Phytophthora infestans TaxID=4787 RepID=A0A8S9VCU2_PHYIN|nr:Ankyrin repeats domain-containing protein [Phytophthora infestans]
MASLQERLRLMTEDPRRRQVPKTQVHAALIYQREFVHRSEDFNTSAISDCAESLEVLKNGKREALETRQMMWEDHYATQTHAEQSRNEASRQQKLRQETAMLTQLKSDTDKWNMAIQLSLLEYLDVTLSAASDDVKSIYFVSTNKAGLPPLHRACKTNDVALVKLLLKVGADLTTKDNFEKSVFHVMAECRLTELFKYLVTLLTKETEGILLSLNSSGNSLLHLAAANGSDGVLAELLKSSIRDDVIALVDLVTPDEKRTALHLAALRGHIACVELLLKLAGAKTDLRDRGGSTALHLAMQQTFDIEKLITVFLNYTPMDQQETTFSSMDEENGQSCLHTAIIKNFRKVTMALIRSGKAQVNAATRDGGWTPLHLAVITEEVDVIKELLTTGAMLDAVDADGQTPLLQACLGGKLKIVRLLLNAGANPAHQNKQAHSPLHYLSAFCRDRQLLRDIIANGADVNAKSMKLNTPMHFAAMNGNEVATQVLLEYGASASVINEDKRSVVYLAKKWRHRSVEDLVRPPEEEDGHGDVHSSSGHRNKPRSPASRQAQLRSMQQHARSAGRSRPRTGVVITTRSEESDSESLYDFEDDELILPPSTPWPGAMENSSKSSNNNEKGNKSMPTTGSCQSFSELRNRFTGERSPLKPVVLAQDRQQVLMDEIVATRAKREAHQFPVVRTNTTRFSRHLVVQPVRIPWEMTVPVTTTSKADALSNQRKLKPSIRTNLGLLRDHLAHAPQLHWPSQTGHSVFQKTNT